MKHDFGIIDQFEAEKWYNKYEPQIYNCISVNMQIIDYIIKNYMDKLEKMKTYICISTQVFYGIAESEVTLIPPESLKSFYNIVEEANANLKSYELERLMLKINEAMQTHKYMIHYGI